MRARFHVARVRRRRGARQLARRRAPRAPRRRGRAVRRRRGRARRAGRRRRTSTTGPTCRRRSRRRRRRPRCWCRARRSASSRTASTPTSTSSTSPTSARSCRSTARRASPTRAGSSATPTTCCRPTSASARGSTSSRSSSTSPPSRTARRSAAARIVTEEWEHKGHRFVRLDVLHTADGRPVARTDHTAIYRPRGDLSSTSPVLAGFLGEALEVVERRSSRRRRWCRCRPRCRRPGGPGCCAWRPGGR